MKHAKYLTLATVLGFSIQGVAEVKNIKSSVPISSNQEQKTYPDLAKISIQEAVKNATAQVKGKPLKVELEEENDTLVYEVEVASASGIQEVIVDPGNGKVLDIHDDEVVED